MKILLSRSKIVVLYRLGVQKQEDRTYREVHGQDIEDSSGIGGVYAWSAQDRWSEHGHGGSRYAERSVSAAEVPAGEVEVLHSLPEADWVKSGRLVALHLPEVRAFDLLNPLKIDAKIPVAK